MKSSVLFLVFAFLAVLASLSFAGPFGRFGGGCSDGSCGVIPAVAERARTVLEVPVHVIVKPKPDQAKPDQVKAKKAPDQVKAKPDQTKAKAKPDQAKPDQVKAKKVKKHSPVRKTVKAVCSIGPRR